MSLSRGGEEGGNGEELREGCRDFNDGERNWLEMRKEEGGGGRGQVGKGSNIDACHGIIGCVGGGNEVFLLWE